MMAVAGLRKLLKTKRLVPTVVAILIISPLLQIIGLLTSKSTVVSLRNVTETAVNVGLGISSQSQLTPRRQSVHLDNTMIKHENVSDLLSFYEPLNAKQMTIIGSPRDRPGYLTIGIPTVTRKVAGTTYLKYTLQSLIDETSPEEKKETVVLVLVADWEKRDRDVIVKFITTTYSDYIHSGFIQIMQVDKSAYPRLDGLKRNYNDAEDRVKWRSKQVADFAFMFSYGRNLSHYYMQLEDDVKSCTQFLTHIKLFVEKQNKDNPKWAMLDFSELGFIGKLFKSSDLDRFSKFLVMFYAEMPVDWLMTFFHQLLAQKKQLLRKPTLFQHMGEYSSFAVKGKNKLKDRYFAGGKVSGVMIPTPLGKNPAALVCTTIEHYKDYLPINGYNDASPDFFWGKTPKRNDTFTVAFKAAKVLKELYIETGTSKQQNDFLRHGYVRVGRTRTGDCACDDYQRIGDFSSGKFVGEKLDKVIEFPVRCLQIVVSKEQEEWVIISEITPS